VELRIRRTRYSFLIIFLVISSLLMNTSILNVNDFGIPLFYTSIILFSIYFCLVLVKNDLRVEKNAFSFVFTLLFLLTAIGFLHVFIVDVDFISELKQIVARSLYIVLFFITYLFIRENKQRLDAILLWTKRILKVALIYGIYQYYASKYGLPLFLDFVRNNVSFFATSANEASGWLETYRIFSIWSEPSFSSLPVGMFLYLLFFHINSKREKITWLIIVTFYAYLTYSRLVWMVFVSTLLLSLMMQLVKFIFRKFHKTILEKVKFLYLLLFISIGISWIYIAPIIMDDASAFARSSSVIIGMRIFLDHLFTGTGFNTYPLYERFYAYNIVYYYPTVASHNLFSSYAQQMGILGLLFAVIPLFYVLKLKHVDIKERIIIANIILTIQVFGGDVYYFSSFWFFLGVIAAKNRVNRTLKDTI
jgi:hypothetical protein